MATLAAFLQRPASAAAAAPALIDRDRPLSRAALADESARLATGLAALGIGAGDRVALWLPNVPAWLAAFFACGRLGAIAVSVNTRFRSHELADIVGRAGCRAIVCWPGFRNIDFAGILAGCDREALGALTHVVAYDEEGVALPERIHDRPVVGYRALVAAAPMTADASRPESPCVIFTTSGTTKAPKFVLHDQRTVVRHAGDVARGFGYDAPGTVVLVTAPLCGVFGFTNAMGALAASRPLVMHPTFDADRIGAGGAASSRDAHARERRDDRADARGRAGNAGVSERAVLRLRGVRRRRTICRNAPRRAGSRSSGSTA